MSGSDLPLAKRPVSPERAWVRCPRCGAVRRTRGFANHMRWAHLEGVPIAPEMYVAAPETPAQKEGEMKQIQTYAGWAITVASTACQGGELGDESGYTEEQLGAMRARLDELTEQAVRDAFPGADIAFRRNAGWPRITASWEGDGEPVESGPAIEAWVRDTKDRVFDGGEWAAVDLA